MKKILACNAETDITRNEKTELTKNLWPLIGQFTLLARSAVALLSFRSIIKSGHCFEIDTIIVSIGAVLMRLCDWCCNTLQLFVRKLRLKYVPGTCTRLSI